MTATGFKFLSGVGNRRIGPRPGVCLLLTIALTLPAIADGDNADGAIVIKAGRIHTVSGDPIDDGMIVIRDGKIHNYQAVVPSTWNAGPRDEADEAGPYEASLLDNPVAEPDKPLEVIRTIHSFDPCLACAIHMVDTEQKEITRVQGVGAQCGVKF